MKYTGIFFFVIISFHTISQVGNGIKSVDSLRPTLTEMCERYPTDKCPYAHGFIEVYDRMFADQRDSMQRFFEIGILNGVSHLMWREYFPNAAIFGIDIKDYSEQSKGSGIETFVADQSNRIDLKAFIDKFGGNFDVILDDGGHAMDHQQVSLGYLFRYVRSGGIFIIEDIHTSLPEMYPDPFFKVSEDERNTTLLMIEYFIRTGKIRSQYMTEAEMRYLEANIESIELHYRANSKHSIMAVIRKR